MLAVPVAIVGTFAVMAAFKFSLNNISLFGLVLAIGIVVDDAIVVVENVERWLDRGLQPREATRKAMGEVTGPIIAVALVLCTVFVPLRVHQRHYRPVFPAIRVDDRGFHGIFGIKFTDVQSGSGRDICCGRAECAAIRLPGFWTCSSAGSSSFLTVFLGHARQGTPGRWGDC